MIYASVVTCKYSLQSIRQRNSLSVELDKRKYCIKNIPPWCCVCNYGKKSCNETSLSPKQKSKSVNRVEVRVFFNRFHGTFLNVPGSPSFKNNCSADAYNKIPVGVFLASFPMRVCRCFNCWLYHWWRIPNPWYCLAVYIITRGNFCDIPDFCNEMERSDCITFSHYGFVSRVASIGQSIVFKKTDVKLCHASRFFYSWCA